ncbi:MAG: GWxTD domain-containing protein [Flavobacteriales bacterium]
MAAACTFTSPTQSGSYKMLYDYQSSVLHPEFLLYHHQDDSSTLWFRIHTSELLYTRAAADAPFLSKFRLSCATYKQDGQLLDTTGTTIIDYAHDGAGWLTGSVVLPVDTGLTNMVITCADLKRSTETISYLRSDKQSTYTAQNYLPTDAHTGEPLFGSFAGENQVVRIESNRNAANNDFYIGQYDQEIKLPPPPFSTSTPEMPDLSKTTDEIWDTDSASSYLFLASQGLYFISNDPLRKQGAVLQAANDFFPEVKSTDQLPAPLRYITTKTEFEDIRENYYPKKKVDDFWLECAGSKERARDLIGIYYNRVQEANYYFSSYTEGWRTDRGMIHIVFGNPARIVKQQTYETWIYGEEGQTTTLTFVFRKQEMANVNNVYVLNRDPAFKTYWEKQVTNWRNGRIYSE